MMRSTEVGLQSRKCFEEYVEKTIAKNACTVGDTSHVLSQRMKPLESVHTKLIDVFTTVCNTVQHCRFIFSTKISYITCNNTVCEIKKKIRINYSTSVRGFKYMYNTKTYL